MRPDPEMVPVLIDAAEALKGSQRRLFMAKTVAAMGRGDNSGRRPISDGTGRRSARGCTSRAAA